MADTDQSISVLRYNQVSGELEGFGGGSPQWTQLTLANVDPTQVPVTRLINTTAPLTGGGDLSADRTLGIPKATSSVDGYLFHTDWSTFNNKQTAGSYITALTGDVTATGPGSVASSIASGAITPAKISVTTTDDFTFPRDITAGRNAIVHGSISLDTQLNIGGGTVNLQAFSGFVGINNSTRFIFNSGNIDTVGQLAISDSSSTPDASAKLDVQSTTKGFAPPRMTTTQKNAISSPVEGLVVYDTTLHKLSVFTGTVWETITSS